MVLLELEGHLEEMDCQVYLDYEEIEGSKEGMEHGAVQEFGETWEHQDEEELLVV